MSSQMTFAPSSPLPPTAPRSLGYALLSLALVAAASLIGQAATYPVIPTWYAGLAKPVFNPPNAAFPIAWTTLYALMAYAFWRVLRLPADTPGRTGAIGAYLVQIALNSGWSLCFFGLRSPWLGMAEVVFFLAAVVITWARFRRLDAQAGWCFVPYIAWVAFASVLNLAIALMN